jgi:hypothetical protein
MGEYVTNRTVEFGGGVVIGLTPAQVEHRDHELKKVAKDQYMVTGKITNSVYRGY